MAFAWLLSQGYCYPRNLGEHTGQEAKRAAAEFQAIWERPRTSKENLCDSLPAQIQTRPSEAEVAQLLQEAAQQYEERMRLADLADISAQGEISRPRYAWDNPIGLVVMGASNAELV